MLVQAFERNRREGWTWFEPHLCYDNARLPEALLRAAHVLGDEHARAAGLAAMTWLTKIQTAPRGSFRPVGNASFGQAHAAPAPFDQQPLESAATIDAAWAAFDVTGESAWIEEAQRAYAWYFGEDDLGERLVTPDLAGCYDGLSAQGVNRNQGAESILSYQIATCVMRTRERGRRTSTSR
jgi:hypothetical protein